MRVRVCVCVAGWWWEGRPTGQPGRCYCSLSRTNEQAKAQMTKPEVCRGTRNMCTRCHLTVGARAQEKRGTSVQLRAKTNVATCRRCCRPAQRRSGSSPAAVVRGSTGSGAGLCLGTSEHACRRRRHRCRRHPRGTRARTRRGCPGWCRVWCWRRVWRSSVPRAARAARP